VDAGTSGNMDTPDRSGTIVDIKRLAVHDGPGIRTTFFLKGCPLACRWCHNPECISGAPQLAYYEHKCRNCGICVSSCPAGAHTIEAGKHRFDRSKCRNCGACEPWCAGAALKLYGREMTVREALAIALEDESFYRESGGGVTVSGGEPLFQLEFTRALLAALKRRGVATALDSCAAVGREAIDAVLPYTDLFLIDFKHASAAEHRKLTGRPNDQVCENLRYLSDRGARIEIRIPLVPTCNDGAGDLDAAGRFLGALNIERVRLLPYHRHAAAKYAALGMPYRMPDSVAPPSAEALEDAAEILRAHGLAVALPD